MAGSLKEMLTILVIEDAKADTEMIRIYLEEAKNKYQLRCAESLSEGFYIIEEHPIDLVLLDLNLPDSNGFNTLRRFIEKAPHVPVVVMTGINDQRKGTESVRAGAQDYLVKGEFESRQLIKAIRYSLERFRLQADAEDRATKASDEKSRLEALQKMASLGDWEMDIVNNTMTWSGELFQIFQLSPHSLSPSLSDYLRYVHRDDRDQVEAFFEKAVRYEEYGPLEHRILIDNRIVKILSLRTRIRFDEKTNKVLLLGSVQDITPSENMAMPDASKAPEPEVIKTNPYYSGELFNQISFNIRTPLSTVVHLFFLLEQTNLNKQQSKLIQDLKTTINDLSFTLSNLVNLLILSNDNLPLTLEKFRTLDILESIQRVMSFKGQQHRREVDIYIDPRLSILVKGDSNKLAQLFFCLIELAFAYSVFESFVKLRCTLDTEVDEQTRLHVQMEYTGELPVWPDTETEATAEEILSLLQPSSVDEGRDQLLAVVFLRLCKQLKVGQQVSSQKGEVTIDLTIPLQVSNQLSTNIPKTPRKNIKILLVEDHPMQQISTKQVLTTWSDKVTVTVADNGKIALAKAKETAFDIVLMDLQMPVMDGWDAGANIRQFSSVPIIALSASNSKQEEDRCYQAGFNDYLAKPFQPQELYHRIMLLIQESVENI
jgi:CheY-like chemotaxis protein